MTQDAPDMVSLLESQASPLPIAQIRLAQCAYRLACAGPFAFLVIALMYPPTDPFALPVLPARMLWWTLAFASPLGGALGGVALLLTRHAPAQTGGKNHGRAAMLVGLATTLALPYGTHYLNNIRKASYTAGMRCDSNLRQLNVSMLEYTQDYDEYYPPGASWNAATLPYIQDKFRYLCPEEEVRNVPSYALSGHPLNVRVFAERIASVRTLGEASKTGTFSVPGFCELSTTGYLDGQIQGKRTGDLGDPARTVLLFDSVPGQNQCGGQELLPRPDRHQGFHTIALSDGHVRSVAAADTNALLWTLPPVVPSWKPPTARETR